MSMMDGRVVLVTGASRGLGRGIALVMAEQGCDVVVNYHSSAEEAEEVAAGVEALGRRALAVQADVSDEADVGRLFRRVDESFGRLDVLINNAGTCRAEQIHQTELSSWEHVLRNNLTSCFLCSRAAMARMTKAGFGRIINIGSVVGHNGALCGHIHYAASKSGMLGMTKTLARSGAAHGVTVNCVAPGIIDTALLHQTHGKRVEQLADSVPLGLGTARDVGLAVAFLAGEGGRYITGTTLDVNGGMYLR